MKRILITGASSGLGLALAKHYLAGGDQVIACGREHAKLESAFAQNTDESASEHTATNISDRLLLCVCDVSQRQSSFDALSHFKDLDIVILNAGTCEYVDDPMSIDSELFSRVMQTNVMGVVHCLQALLPNIKRGGQLAVVSSSVTVLPLTRSEAYGASKAALDYLTRSLAIDLSQHGIDVSLISPGFVDTPLTQKNDFPMSGLVSVERAKNYIVRGLSSRKRHIVFPRRFYWSLKALSLLPNGLWHRLAVKMVRPGNER